MPQRRLCEWCKYQRKGKKQFKMSLNKINLMNKTGIRRVLLHNGGFCNGCITERIFSTYIEVTSFPFVRKPILFRKWEKTLDIFSTFIFYHRAVMKQDHYMTHFFELRKHRFVMQPLQYTPLCSSTIGRILFMLIRSSTFSVWIAKMKLFTVKVYYFSPSLLAQVSKNVFAMVPTLIILLC